MIHYKEKEIIDLEATTIDQQYKELLQGTENFFILHFQSMDYALTKEKSFFLLENKQKFIEETMKDDYYHTVIKDHIIEENDTLTIFKKYIKQYRNLMEKQLYGNKYLFGSVAVRINQESFVTTIRGKENLDEYTIVQKVDFNRHEVLVNRKKATLNAPLLAHLFKNPKVKVIVHINHTFDEKLPYLEYAFPGTVRDSIRSNTTSFNIQYHGLFYLFDEDGNLL